MRRAALVLAAIVVTVVAVSAPVTLARFTGTGDVDASFATGSILPPTSVSSTVAGGVVTLTWTATTSEEVQGYDILRSATSGGGYSVVGSVTPRTATTAADSPGAGTWYYVLRSTLENWRSDGSNETSATVVNGSTGPIPCTTNAADTGGDGNGYQLNAANACVVDGAYATDTGTGSNTNGTCSNAGKDRHRFGGYSFGLPETVSSIDGIEVQVVVGMNNNGGTTNNVCAQLSWDGGATWSETRLIAISGTALTAYTLGGPGITWARTWTPADLTSGSFVVRLTNVSSHPTKDIHLDGVSVQVHYTP